MKLCRLGILALALTLGCGAALADNLNVGGIYNTFDILEGSTVVSEGGGSITPTTLNGTILAWVYCVGLYTNINVPGDYADTTTTNNGFADGTVQMGTAANATFAQINNAGEIAWLLDNFAAGAVGNSSNEVLAQEALQAAIWHVEYDGAGFEAGMPVVNGDSSAGYFSDYTADLTALGSKTAALNTVDWFSPSNGSDINQALVGPATAGVVPEPTSILLFGTVLLFSARSLKRKKLGANR